MEEKFLNSTRNILALLCTAIYGAFVLGTARLNAQLFLACMEQFHIGRKEASYPFTLVYIVRSISGPFTGYFGRKYGARKVTNFGCFLCVIGIGGCFFAQNITEVSILWGVVYGLGSGFGSLLVPHILHDFFDQHYDKSHGFFAAGCGIGGILLPFLADTLLFTYGAPGTYLIMSAIVMNCFVASLVLRFLKRGPIMYEKPVPRVLAIDVANVTEIQHQICHTSLRNGSECPQQSKNVVSDWRTCQSTNPTRLYELNGEKACKTNTLQMENISTTTGDSCTEKQNPQKHGSKESNRPSENVLMEILRLFIDPPYIIIVITQCISILIIQILLTIIIDFARDIGVPPDMEVYVMMILATSDTVGRVFSGFITDGGYLSQLNFYILCFLFMGMMFSIMTLMKSFLSLSLTLVVVGLIQGGLTMIGVGFMFDFIDKENMILAVPCRFVLYPLLGLSKPFLLEFFREIQGSYNGLMYFLTCVCIFNATLSMFLPAAKRIRGKLIKKKKEKSHNDLAC